MEANEITMFMDAKLDIHGKRPESLKFKTWTRCQVKIEAIKCLPSFLRISFTRSLQVGVEHADNLCDKMAEPQVLEETPQLSVSINVPGVSVSQTESRTKQHSYGLFWKQNRRDCFIYFAIESEASCRRHMKWIRKSIKNLELHRQLFLEQRRNSRGPGRGMGYVEVELLEKLSQQVKQKTQQTKFNALGSTKDTLVKLPIPATCDISHSAWSTSRVSRVSEIYEEIFEQDNFDMQQQQPPRLSRRFSRTSIASGIYEEMKPTAANFKAIVEEPPALPPLPPPRKRINTFETDPAGLLGEIPRSNTNPESELAKKKKYKNMLDNIFGGVGRAKRAESVSESAACSAEELIESKADAVYENAAVSSAKRIKKPPKMKGQGQQMSAAKRNSFSSPDLSKINFLETFDEERMTLLLQQDSFSNSDDDFDLSNESLDESSIHPVVAGGKCMRTEHLLSRLERSFKADSLESLNISQQIPINFNFSACNSSAINLVGSNGAASLLHTVQKNKIIIDDLTGYCVMAPIKKKLNVDNAAGLTQSVTSSGYSTGSSTTSSTEDNSAELKTEAAKLAIVAAANDGFAAIAEESTIYENMLGGGGSLNSSSTVGDFSGNLYENLLAVKAAQELAPSNEPSPVATAKMSTSTPTGGVEVSTPPAIRADEEEESFYQTPRKSIISVDDKVPSYYPNSCDTSKMIRRSHSPTKVATPISSCSNSNEKPSSASFGLRHLVNTKMRRERKENYYISSPQKIVEQHQSSNATSSKSKSNKSKKTAAAHKISEHLYAVSHLNKKCNNNNNNPNLLSAEALQEKLQSELLQLAALQNIDFKFDDSKATAEIISTHKKETENCFQAKESATRILHKYATLARSTTAATTTTTTTGTSNITPQRGSAVPQHHLQQSQQSNTQQETSRAAALALSAMCALSPSPNKLDANVVAATAATELQLGGSGVKKFASLPRFKKIDFSPLKLKINNVLQRNQQQQEL